MIFKIKIRAPRFFVRREPLFVYGKQDETYSAREALQIAEHHASGSPHTVVTISHAPLSPWLPK